MGIVIVIAGNPSHVSYSGRVKGAHLRRMFMTRGICLTDIARILSLANCQNTGRQYFMELCELWIGQALLRFSLSSIRDLESEAHKIHRRRDVRREIKY